MNDIKISIVIPVYNAGSMLQTCVMSILDQSYKNIEIILVDDGSTDGSGEYLDTLQTDSRCKVIHKQNGGVQSARRLGIANATGNYLTFVDADDYLEKNTYDECVKVITRFDPSICMFRYKPVFSEYPFYHPKHKCFEDIEYREIEKQDIFDNVFSGYNIGGFIWNKVWKKEIISQIDFHDDFQITEDSVFVWDSLALAESVVIIEKELYNYRIVFSSMTRNSSVTKYLAAGETWNYLQNLAESIKSQSITGICENKVVWYLLAASAISASAGEQSQNKLIVLSHLSEVSETVKGMSVPIKVKYYSLHISWRLFGIVVKIEKILSFLRFKLRILREKLDK